MQKQKKIDKLFYFVLDAHYVLHLVVHWMATMRCFA